MEASQFVLRANPDAHGGFDKNKQAELIVGAGRESISGAFPLFLFKEHFNIARKKIPQILGFMCTLDPLGYNKAQFFTVPFLVLHRAFIDYASDKTSEIKKLILKQVYKVC